ncbi:MAG: FAD-dependent oxidoreductase [Victivallales bacterium]|nr:FAD-dependent oxidoreductase [Victivallales bacterium]
MKIVVIGGVAAGPKAASRIVRICPDAEVTILEKGEFLSYAGCGLPYYVSGEIKDQKELMATPIGVVRDTAFFQNVKNVTVLNRTVATAIDRKAKTVSYTSGNGDTGSINYDKLVLATGASPVMPPIPGIELPNIFKLHGVEDAEGVKNLLQERKARDAVIVGGGLIGVEMAESLVSTGCRVTIVEMVPHILTMMDPEMSMLVERYFEQKGVKILTNTKVTGFEGDGKLERVNTTAGLLPADLAILAIGVRPNSKLAVDCGLETGVAGAIKVDQRMRTSDENILAAGDCVEVRNLVTGDPCFVPLGSTANKHGRVAANTVCGLEDSFHGVQGSSICKIFDFSVARTGLCEAGARKAGYDIVTVLTPAPDKAHFMHDAKPLLLKMIADRKTRRLLGVQATGMGEADKRIDVAAVAITAEMTVDQVANLDLSYAPPFSPAMDNLLVAANVIRNKIDGKFDGITPMAVKEKMERGDDFVMLDVRSPGEVEQMRIEPSLNIPLGKIRSSLDKLDKEKEIIAFCKISLRGYEAALILQNAGFKNVKVMDGGILMWPYEIIKA